MPGELLFRTRQEADAYLRAALRRGDDGGHGDDEGDRGEDKAERGVTRGVRMGVTKWMRRKRSRGPRRGVPGAKMSPGNPTPRKRGRLRVVTRERGAGGQGGLLG